MKKLHIVGNWKMSLNKEDSLKLAHNIKLINKFIKNCSGFWNEELENIDKKHQNIVSKFNQSYKNKIER